MPCKPWCYTISLPRSFNLLGRGHQHQPLPRQSSTHPHTPWRYTIGVRKLNPLGPGHQHQTLARRRSTNPQHTSPAVCFHRDVKGPFLRHEENATWFWSRVFTSRLAGTGKDIGFYTCFFYIKCFATMTKKQRLLWWGSHQRYKHF